jgi:ABC-type uncharacterized transport system
MAIVADRPGQTAKGSRSMAGGLLWAALVLGLLTWWLAAKFGNTDSSITAILAGILAVLALGLSVATWLRPVSKKLLGAAFLLGGAVLVLLGVWLLVQEGLTAFGEFASAIVMGLIAFGTGLAQLHPPEGPTIQDRFVRTLVGSLPVARVGSLVLAAIFAGVGVWLVLAQGWLVIYPEATGLFLLGLIFVGAGIWLAVATPPDATPTRLRILVLLVGGLTGLVITLATVLRVLLWWTPVFAAGIRTWQGTAGWQVWACVYAGLAGLAIMFGSLLLARADVRTNVVLRRLLYGYNAILTGLLLLAILVVINVVVYVSYPYTFDWTQTRGIHTLSPSSKNLLEGLKEPAKVYVIMSPNSSLYSETRQLLENARAYTNKLEVQYISPDRDRRVYEDLAMKYPDLIREGSISRAEEDNGSRGILVVYGPESEKKPPHAFIAQRDLFEFKGPTMPGDRKSTLAYKGEDAIMTQLRFLENNQTKPKVYFTQGNGELDITDAGVALTTSGLIPSPTGAGRLVDRLKKDNYDVRGLLWSALPKNSKPGDLMSYAKKDATAPDVVPEDAKIVVIAGPRSRFSKTALDALEHYLQGNGKLIVLSRSLLQRPSDGVVYKTTGLEDVLKKFNVELEPNCIVSLQPQGGRVDLVPLVLVNPPQKSKNKIAANFEGYVFEMIQARTVRGGTGPGNFTSETILEAPKESADQIGCWAETDFNRLLNLPAYLRTLVTSGQIQKKLSDEPLPVALAVSDREQKPRMVVFGDYTFASNTVANNAPYYDFVISSMEWLAERPANIGIKPKESSSFVLGSNVNFRGMILLPVGLMILAIVGVGSGIWVVRRR